MSSFLILQVTCGLLPLMRQQMQACSLAPRNTRSRFRTLHSIVQISLNVNRLLRAERSTCMLWRFVQLRLLAFQCRSDAGRCCRAVQPSAPLIWEGGQSLLLRRLGINARAPAVGPLLQCCRRQVLQANLHCEAASPGSPSPRPRCRPKPV